MICKFFFYNELTLCEVLVSMCEAAGMKHVVLWTKNRHRCGGTPATSRYQEEEGKEQEEAK